jgi:two-component system response regulator VicR
VPKKILVVDDEPHIVRLAKIKLVSEGFDVVEAYNGEEALEKVSLENPDLIILDVMMPKMDGWEVARRLRSSRATRDIPIMMLTARGLGEEPEERLAKVDEYFAKPFSPRELARVVRNLLE